MAVANKGSQIYLRDIAAKITCPSCNNFYRGNEFDCESGHKTCNICTGDRDDGTCPMEGCGSLVEKSVKAAGMSKSRLCSRQRQRSWGLERLKKRTRLVVDNR